MSIYTKHYNGEVILEFLEDEHTYLLHLQNEELIRQAYSVTDGLSSINKPQLNRWKMRKAMEYVKKNIYGKHFEYEWQLDKELERAMYASDEVSDGAADIGTRIHKHLENYVEALMIGEEYEPELKYGDNELVGLESFINWTNNKKIEWISTETRAISRKHFYCGTFDARAIVDGQNSIIDYKCVNRLYDTYLFQGAAYAKAIEEEYGDKIEKIYILRIPKEKNIRVPRTTSKEAEGAEIDEYFEAFLHSLEMKKIIDKFGL